MSKIKWSDRTPENRAGIEQLEAELLRLRTGVRCLRMWERHYQPEQGGIALCMSWWGNECGTALCAAGYLTTRPAMQKLGLGHSSEEDFEPTFMGRVGFQALELFFGFDAEELERAFGSWRAFTRPEEAAEALQGLADKKRVQWKAAMARQLS